MEQASPGKLPTVGVGEFDEPLDLRNGKPWIIFADVSQRTARVETGDNGIG